MFALYFSCYYWAGCINVCLCGPWITCISPGKENVPALALTYARVTGVLRGKVSRRHAPNTVAVTCSGVAEKVLGSCLAASEAQAVSSVPVPEAVGCPGQRR